MELFSAIRDSVTSVLAVAAVPIVTWIVARGSRRATAEQELIKTLQSQDVEKSRQIRIQSDYIYELRAQLATAGLTPEPWPEGMNR